MKLPGRRKTTKWHSIDYYKAFTLQMTFHDNYKCQWFSFLSLFDLNFGLYVKKKSVTISSLIMNSSKNVPR